MGTVITQYFHLECSGPAPTPAFKHCPSVSKGGWDESEVEAEALVTGWVFEGKKTLCPMCRPAAAPKVKAVGKTPATNATPIKDHGVQDFPQEATN